MIPRIIHQIWINPKDGGSAGGLPAVVDLRCKKWRELHPTFLYRRWQLDDIVCLAGDEEKFGARTQTALAVLRFPAAQADVARLFLLYYFGGFYVDLKLDPKRDFLRELLEFELVLTEHFPKQNLPVPNGFLINSFIGAKPNSEYIGRVLDRVLCNVEARQKSSIFDITGPINFGAIRAQMTAAARSLGYFKMLKHEETWEILFSVAGAPYNDDGMHWSVRGATESVYRDD